MGFETFSCYKVVPVKIVWILWGLNNWIRDNATHSGIGDGSGVGRRDRVFQIEVMKDCCLSNSGL